MFSLHYVIIGNGGAGVSALESIRNIDNVSDITIISREQYPTYSPCSLPNLISGEINKVNIFRFEKNFYKHLNAKFVKNTEVYKIIPLDKRIIFRNGKYVEFDKLLIAAGAKPITPKRLKQLNLQGVHIMGTLDSSLRILSHINQGVNRAVVLGGGFMGVETATMLKKQGIKTSIIELLPNILSKMLDSDMSQIVAKKLEEHDITLYLNNTIKKINGDKKVESVSLRKNKINCDMLVVAIGVTPNIHIVQNSGIKTNHGIIVNSEMQTNMNNIYAAGDIAEVHEHIEGRTGIFAIWPNAIEQGRIAGLNMADKKTTYSGADVVNVLDIFNTPIVAMGFTSQVIKKCKVISRFTPDTYKRILIKNNRIIGLQFIGTIRNTGVFYSLMKKGTDISSIEDRLLDDNFIITP